MRRAITFDPSLLDLDEPDRTAGIDVPSTRPLRLSTRSDRTLSALALVVAVVAVALNLVRPAPLDLPHEPPLASVSPVGCPFGTFVVGWSDTLTPHCAAPLPSDAPDISDVTAACGPFSDGFVDPGPCFAFVPDPAPVP